MHANELAKKFKAYLTIKNYVESKIQEIENTYTQEAKALLIIKDNNLKATKQLLKESPKFKKLRLEWESVIRDIKQQVFWDSGDSEWSGITNRTVVYGDSPNAFTTLSEGDRYAGKMSIYTKTNAEHILTLKVEDIIFMADHQKLLFASRLDYCPLISLQPTTVKDIFKAVWVVFKRKRLQTVEGYIAKHETSEGVLTLYHATTMEQADTGLKKKLNKNKQDVVKVFKPNTKLSIPLVMRLFGWCKEGCKNWANKYLDGNVKPTRVELRKGVKLALENKCQYAPILNDLLKRYE